jgi:hypothetical protein
MSILRASNLSAFDVKDAKTTKDYSFCCFISDQKLPPEVVNVLRNHAVRFTEYEPEIFLNKPFVDFEKEGINVIWVNINDHKALHWLQLNVSQPAKYHVVSVYKVKSSFNKWLDQVKDVVDNSLSLKTLLSIKSINIKELIQKVVEYSKISRPKKWYVRVLLWLGKKLGVL